MIADISRLSPRYEFCQKTFRNSINAVGVGVHSGQRAHITFNPAPIDTGLVFRRTDVNGKDNVIPADYKHVVDTRMCSCFGNASGVTVSTAEHVMAALASFGITNAYIDIDGPEIPIMDGSAKEFIFLFECAGVLEQDAPLKVLKITKKVVFEDGKGACASLSPSDNAFSADFSIDFAAAVIGHQEHSMEVNKDTFKNEISYARTFGMKEEVEMLHKMGLGRGGSLENAIVVDGDHVLNPEGLRNPTEFVRHKILDAIGDLYQSGMPIIGHFSGSKSGHFHNNALLKAVFADESNYEIIEADTLATEVRLEPKVQVA